LQLNIAISNEVSASMVEESKGPKSQKKVKPEELMSMFRSKEDLDKYLT